MIKKLKRSKKNKSPNCGLCGWKPHCLHVTTSPPQDQKIERKSVFLIWKFFLIRAFPKLEARAGRGESWRKAQRVRYVMRSLRWCGWQLFLLSPRIRRCKVFVKQKQRQNREGPVHDNKKQNKSMLFRTNYFCRLCSSVVSAQEGKPSDSHSG